VAKGVTFGPLHACYLGSANPELNADHTRCEQDGWMDHSLKGWMMKNVLLLVMGTGGLCLATLFLLGANPAARTPTQWEYGVYRSFAGHYLWQDDRTDVQAENIQAFAHALGLKARADGDMVETVLINHFGRQGWELAFVQTPGDTIGGWAYWFKRPK
jgi:hypothetical protein